MIRKYNIKKEDFTRINNDVNGNPRYVLHFSQLITDDERERFNKAGHDFGGISARYAHAIKKANKLGGRKYHNKQYGGGIVFQSYNLDSLITSLQAI